MQKKERAENGTKLHGVALCDIRIQSQVSPRKYIVPRTSEGKQECFQFYLKAGLLLRGIEAENQGRDAGASRLRNVGAPHKNPPDLTGLGDFSFCMQKPGKGKPQSREGTGAEVVRRAESPTKGKRLDAGGGVC